MKESNFQFTNPSLSYLKFEENKDFVREQNEKIEIGTEIKVGNHKIDDTKAIVSIFIKIGEEAVNVPFCIKTEFEAEFMWNKELNNEKVELFLNQNAPALLLSYVRPIISMITNASYFPVYNLPFINFTDVK